MMERLYPRCLFERFYSTCFFHFFLFRRRLFNFGGIQPLNTLGEMSFPKPRTATRNY